MRMASEKVTRVTCDVCGKQEDFTTKNTWNREVWVHAIECVSGWHEYMTLRKIDICDDCLMTASRLRIDINSLEYKIED